MLQGSDGEEERARKRAKITKVAFQRSPGIDFLALESLLEIRSSLQRSSEPLPEKASLRARDGGAQWNVSEEGLRLGRCTTAWDGVDVRLSTMKASKVHAEILPRSLSPPGGTGSQETGMSGYVIQVRGKNGLTVDGERLSGADVSEPPPSKRLKHGSLIQIGEQAFEFVVAS